MPRYSFFSPDVFLMSSHVSKQLDYTIIFYFYLVCFTLSISQSVFPFYLVYVSILNVQPYMYYTHITCLYKRVLPRKCTGHSKHPLPTTQEKTLHMDITRWSALISCWQMQLCDPLPTGHCHSQEFCADFIFFFFNYSVF